MKQFQITQISNGFLVGVPPQNNNEPPTAIYCEDLTAVYNVLKQLWPKENNISILH